jgi:biopolymer transport protein ExbD
MRFKKGRQGSELPEVNLIPLMDVILSVLTFFILASLSLTRQQAVDVTLPSADAGAQQQKIPDPFVVGLNQRGQILVENQPIDEAQLAQRMQTYLTSNPKGAVVLKADRKLPYEQVVKVLGRMRSTGGDRVSLAIDQG